MSVTRACDPCRRAKARCDLGRPACSRCVRRGFDCVGYTAEPGGLIFRDETVIAQRNSERARREPRGSVPIASFDVSMSDSAAGGGDDAQHEVFPWLNAEGRAGLPEPLRRDQETRAIDRFFIDWSLHPCNHGITPGHLHDLPTLYLGAPPESVLRLAVEAVAFADMRGASGSDNAPFQLKARRQYGAALTRMRTVAADEQRVANDRVLAALLLIDNFELMFLARAEPLGPHGDAVRHILHARGNEQLYSGHSFALWRVAHHRLQARQLLRREGPQQEQLDWFRKLDTSKPDLHISADVLHMNVLCAAVRRITEESNNLTPAAIVEQAARLKQTIEEFLESAETWFNKLSSTWKPQEIGTSSFRPPQDMDNNEAASLAPDGVALQYHDNWLAYMWNFHSASQIILRESLTELINFVASVEERELTEVETEGLQRQNQEVFLLAKSIIEAMPPLLGFTKDSAGDGRPQPRGKMAGRFFVLYSMWVVQKAHNSSDEQKQIAYRTDSWMRASHGLD